MQLMRQPNWTAGQGNHPIAIPNSTTVYVLDGQGRALIAESDVPYLRSQGWAPAANIITDLFVNSGVIASGTASVALGVLPASWYIEGLILQNLTANAISGGINVGSTVGGNDIVSALAIGASALIVVTDALVLKRAFSTSAVTSLFVSAVTSWNNANLNAKAVLRPF